MTLLYVWAVSCLLVSLGLWIERDTSDGISGKHAATLVVLAPMFAFGLVCIAVEFLALVGQDAVSRAGQAILNKVDP